MHAVSYAAGTYARFDPAARVGGVELDRSGIDLDDAPGSSETQVRPGTVGLLR